MPKVSSRHAAATIGDVADAAGVSRATVSRVMNGRSSVNAALTERVRAVAAELQYRPSTIARSLSLGRTETVALVVPELANPMFQHVLAGITEAAAADGYRVLVADTEQNPGDEVAIALDARRRCDALVLVSPRMSSEELAQVIREASPVVLVNRDSPDATTPSITVNYRAGAAAVLDHLVAWGHRRIVYLAGPESSTSDVRRRDGLRDVADRHPDLTLIDVPGGATVAAGYAALAPVLAARPTAVVAFNDLAAFGLLAALNQAGVAVPKDISVTGFDDIELAQYSTPSLTTAAVPQHDIGRHAWQELHAVIEKQDAHASTSTRFEPRLEERASTGPVPRTIVDGTVVDGAAITPRAATPAAPSSDISEPTLVSPRWSVEGEARVLDLGGLRLARYETGGTLPQVHSRRPFLHPVHTLAGQVVTDVSPLDHRHHYGVSLALPDVNGTSYWGGRTFVRDVGPTLLHNHGVQVSSGAQVDAEDPHLLHDSVHWVDQHGAAQLEEYRTISAHALPREGAWALGWRSVLRADHGALVIGSPATNGRPGAGYGGWFWRLPIADRTQVFSEDGEGEELAHGGSSPWLAFVQHHGGASTTWICLQHGTPLPWFVRAAEYPGAGPSLAWDQPLQVPAGGTLEIGLTSAVIDGALTRAEASDLAATLADIR